MPTSSPKIEHLRFSINNHGSDSFARVTTAAVTTAVVFVHGFGGHPVTTWTDFEHLIDMKVKKPEEWDVSDLYFYGYNSKGRSIDDSADELADFVKAVFPKADLSAIGTPDAPSELGLVRTYERLVLVGHSEGGVVIRWAVAIAGQRAKHSAQQAPILNARLALFAPALFGFVPTGWLGVAAVISGVRRLIEVFIAHSPSGTEMKDKTFLMGVQEHTMTCYNESPKTPAYTAHILFGQNEQVVVRRKYVQDCRHEPESGKDHFSICKPDFSYPRPLKVPFGDCP
jgi:pimeloyl-ACP methyl ester carboxylesterase